MKEIIGKSKIKSTNIPRKLKINNVGVYNKREIADAFNYFSIISLQILVRNWPVKYKNHLNIWNISIKWMSKWSLNLYGQTN